MTHMLREAALVFYRERDRRRNEYLAGAALGAAPIHITVGRDALADPSGQILVLSLANLLARAHRRVAFQLIGGDVERKVMVPFGGERNVGGTILGLAAAIDPWGEFHLYGHPPTDDAVTLGIGDAGCGLQWYVGADRAIAKVSHSPEAITRALTTVRGAALAACLGASNIFLRQLGRLPRQWTLSAWNWAEGPDAVAGPDALDSVAVGDVLLVGGGAVGNAAAYWLRLLGADSNWAIVDGDLVKLHNTDRSLLFTAAHAGWPDGYAGGVAAMKAEVLANWLPRAVAHPRWYDQCPELMNRSFDLVLALANERQVRHLLAARLPAIALQATTGERFLAQLHRHVLGRDDCIACRTGGLVAPRLECSTERVELADGTSADAALPFLSAASGLMLAIAVQRLHAGELGDEIMNRWDWRLGADPRVASAGRHKCRDGCQNMLSADIRAQVTAGGRWAHLVR